MIDHEIRKNAVEQNVPPREVSASVAAIGDFGETVETLEEFGYDAVRRLYPLLLQKVKPDRVYIEDGVLSKLKRVQDLSRL